MISYLAVLLAIMAAASAALTVVSATTAALASSSPCTFCAVNAAGQAVNFDLSTLPTTSYTQGEYVFTSPCGQASSGRCGTQSQPALQGCKGIGSLPNVTVVLNSDGFDLTLHNGFDDPPMPKGRNAVYHFVCDKSAPANAMPTGNVTETPPGFYNLEWRTPAACGKVGPGSTCGPVPPAPPPVPPPAPCMAGSDRCVPTWEPTWDMRNSTVLYTCNNSGMHNVTHANQFGTVVYDWSNAKAIWANAHPMDSEELITKQAEMVYAQDPGVPGYGPRVWAYRNTIKALNWYSSVREKIDDPKYASWFIKFKGFSDSPYPGGAGKAQNGTFHVPTCDWYDNGTAPRCSGFYHDQEQTPEHPGGGSAYRVDGDCIEQCDCGATNPCGEYIFDHRGGEVEGRTFRDWFINEYMITDETLFHKNPATGKPQPINLGWLDDSMRMDGPTEEDKNFIADTGFSTSEMQELVDAYQASIQALIAKLIPLGGFYWQLMKGNGAQLNTDTNQTLDPSTCKSNLAARCKPNGTESKNFMMYNVPHGGTGCGPQCFTDYTAEFLLTRGPYAMLGYSWCGCTNGAQMRPRASEWDEDFGLPVDSVCSETSPGSGIFKRSWSKADVVWDCNAGHGRIQRH